MAYRIHAGEPPQDALRRIAREQVERALDELEDSDLDVHATVHAVRKRCKKVRGLLRLVRPAFSGYADENRCFRDAARGLSALRDAQARLECFDALVARLRDSLGDDPFPDVREWLEAERRTMAARDAEPRLSELREALEPSLHRIDEWSLDEGRAEPMDALGPGFAKVYRRARKQWRKALADPSTEPLHEWRKRVKYHRYHLRLLREAWPAVLGPMRDEAKKLSDRLGDDHDLAVLREAVVGAGATARSPGFEALPALIDTRRQELQAWAIPLGRRLLAQKPGRSRRHLAHWWKAGEIERQLGEVLPSGSEAVS